MKIERIRIKRFKLFKDIEIRDLSDMCVFLGANGSGKTSLFDVFGFLSDAMKNDLSAAISRRGGFKSVASKEHDGDIEFEIQLRNNAAGGKKQPLITYNLCVGLENSHPVAAKEILSCRQEQSDIPFELLSFSKGRGLAISNEEEYETGFREKREELMLDSPDILAIKGLGQFRRFKTVSSLRRVSENWHISDFSISEARLARNVRISDHLTPTGDNLAFMAQYIYQNHRKIFNEILEKMKQRIPGLSRVEAVETPDGRIILQFHDGAFKDPFNARYVSDGVLKMFACLILLHDPKPRPLLCIEEPENYLHPDLLPELAEEFREYANKGGQVFISTHSPDFVNAVRVEELFWLTKTGGFSQVSCAKDDPVVKSLYEAGDQLGCLWTQNYLKGGGIR